MAQVVVEEVAQASRGLELGHVGVQVQTIDAPDLERHVLADNAVDVGRHQNLLAESPVMVLLTKTPILDRSQHQTAAQRPSPKVRRRW
jgi:hypothetical protein